ncbi:hypothetical protein TcYC6_0054310 [Trypanosoma cruzi]|nr:hypothetical protein TcYC6_0054310 [Trypanosoma cruzi]
MAHHRNGAAPHAFFSITNQRTGEVLLELTSFSLPLPATTAASVEESQNCCRRFNDAFAFVTEAQARSYDLFGRSMAKESSTRPAAAVDAPRARKEKDVDMMMAYEAPSSSVMDSAEWEDDDAWPDDGDHDEEDGRGLLGPPTKKTRR